MSAPAVPLVGQQTPAQLRQKLGQMIAQAVEDPSAGTQFLQDVSFRIVGPSVFLEQMRSPLDVTKQRVVVPVALLLSIAAHCVGIEAQNDLAQLGIQFGPPKA